MSKILCWILVTWYQIAVIAFILVVSATVFLPSESPVRRLLETLADSSWLFEGGAIANVLAIVILFRSKPTMLRWKWYRQFLTACLISFPIYGPIYYLRLLSGAW